MCIRISHRADLRRGTSEWTLIVAMSGDVTCIYQLGHTRQGYCDWNVIEIISLLEQKEVEEVFEVALAA